MFNGVATMAELSVSHLFYADDKFIFCEAGSEQLVTKGVSFCFLRQCCG